jgi:2-aminoadipate transaminase
MTIEDHGRGAGRGPAGRREQVRVATKEPLSRSTSRDLERYAGLFASRTRVMKSSAMRDLMAITARAEVISLAGGLPDTSSFPPDTFAALTRRIAEESCARALQYGPTEGLDETKGRIAEVMAAEGMRADADDMIVTTGGQQVIDLVTKTLIDPGDVVVAEAPTYPGAVPVFSSYQADVVQIEVDSDGMRVDLLEETLARLDREGRRPKFIYTVPSFQNPAGVTMSLERRRHLVEVAHARELLVLEDNPYGLLRYEGEAEPTLHALDGGVYTMYLGTFSKILSPGIRLGWVVAPPPVLEKINLGKQAADLCTSTLSQLMVDAYFQEGRWRDYVDSLAEIYRARRDTMLDALAEFLPPEADWTRPSGGLFIWVTLPDYIDTTDLLARALRDNVAFVPGEAAYLDGRGRSSMRLNFSGVDEDAIREGVRRIGKVVDQQVALYGTLTGRPTGRGRPATAGMDGALDGSDGDPAVGGSTEPGGQPDEREVGAAGDRRDAGDEPGARVFELPRRSAREA